MVINKEQIANVFCSNEDNFWEPFYYSGKNLTDFSVTQENRWTLNSNYGKFYDKPTKVNGILGIDLYLFWINFAGDGKQIIPNTIKTKLDKLNKYKSEHGYINKFANVEKPETINTDKYLGGYPGINKEEKDKLEEKDHGKRWIKWDIHYFKAVELNFYDHNQVLKENNLMLKIEKINNLKNDYWDASGKFVQDTKEPLSPEWMNYGSSGSMVITDQLEVCGIYWGDID